MTTTRSKRKSWSEKLNSPKQAHIAHIPPDQQARYGGASTLLIPHPLEVKEILMDTAPGQLITPSLVRTILAAKHGADTTCPLVTGIFLRIVAEAAEEEKGSNSELPPWWRVISNEGYLNPKFPGSYHLQESYLKAEGFLIIPGIGKKAPTVENFTRSLYRSSK